MTITKSIREKIGMAIFQADACAGQQKKGGRGNHRLKGLQKERKEQKI